MNIHPQHVVLGEPSAFVKTINELIAARDVALTIRNITCHDGRLAAVVDESARIPSSAGALIEVSATRQKDPAKHLAALRETNPMWSIEAVFPVPADGKSKPTAIAVLSLRQP